MQGSSKQEILGNIQYLGLGDLSSRVVALFAFFYTVRILGPEKLGLVSYAASITGLFLPVVDYGLGFIGTREVSKDRSLLQLYVKLIVVCRLFLWILSTAGLLLFLSLSDLSAETQRILILYQLTIVPFVFSMTWASQGIGKTGWFAFDKNVQALLYLVGVVLFVRSAQQYDRLPVLQTLAGLIPAIIILWYLLFNEKNDSHAFHYRHAVRLLQSTFVLFVPLMISQINIPSTLLIVKHMTSLEDVGIYSVSARCMVVFAIFPNLLWSSYYPVISKTTSPEQMSKMGQVLYKYSILIGFVPALFGLFYARDLLDLLFGPGYSRALFSFRVFSVVMLLQSVFIVFTRIMPAVGMDTMFRRLIIVETVGQLILASLLVKIMGLDGGAVSFLSIDLIIVYITLRIMKNKMNLKLWKAPLYALGTILFSLFISELVRETFHAPFLVVLVLGLFLYFGIAVSTSNMTLKDFTV
jgi:polysaccharide transporter, PST family